MSAGGPPVVVKLVEGTQGAGVVLSESRPVAQAVIEAFRVLDANILVQEYIAEAQGADIRCFVVRKRVVASMRRQANPGDFRSNLHGEVTLSPLRFRMKNVSLRPQRRSILVLESQVSTSCDRVTVGCD